MTADAAEAAATPSASIVDRTLHIVGTNAPDEIVLAVPLADPATLLVDFGNDGTVDEQFPRSAFDAVNASLGNGADRFSGGGVPMAQTSAIDGGNGDDTLTGTAGNDTITGGNGIDFVVGGVGRDTGVLDRGDDTFLWNPGDGSDDVNGGSGNDVLRFNGAGGNEIMNLSATGARAVFLRNPGNVQMNLDLVEQLDLHALGGADDITVDDMTGTSMERALVDLSASGDGTAGDGQGDLVTINGSNRDDHVVVTSQGTLVGVSGLRPAADIAGSELADRLQLDTLDGDDDVTIDPSALARISVTTDLGTGQR